MNSEVRAGDIRKLKNEEHQANNILIIHPVTGEEIEVRMKISTEYAFFSELEILEDYNEIIASHVNALIYSHDLMPARMLFGVAKHVQKHHPCYYFSVIEVHLVKVEDENMDEFITSFMNYVKKYFEE